MKYILVLFALCFFFPAANAQMYAFNPWRFSAEMSNQAMRMSAEYTHDYYLDRIKGNIDDLNTNMSAVVLAQNMVYNALANVNSALEDGLEVRYMTTITADMLRYLNQALDMARSEPYLLLFATNIAAEMKSRSVAMVSEVSAYVLKSGNNILMDYNGRDQLLKRVTQTLQILDGLAYGAWRAMFWAKERGIISSINPWQNYINKDKYFVQEIINNAKYLQIPNK